MKVVLLAGGFGTRVSEESQYKPKPMIEIGGMPILWHIMKRYSFYGFNEFVICAGYKQRVIKEWFANYFLYTNDVTFDYTSDSSLVIHRKYSESWKVTVIDTGLNTMTGGRLKRIKDYVSGERFFMTYGDGVSDVNIIDTLNFHKEHKKLVTLTAIKPESRYGNIDFDGDKVLSFREKNQNDAGWINAGFMILEPETLDYIENDSTVFEREPMEKIASEGEMVCYRHTGFWQCMDTLRDKQQLEQLFESGKAPWKIW